MAIVAAPASVAGLTGGAAAGKTAGTIVANTALIAGTTVAAAGALRSANAQAGLGIAQNQAANFKADQAEVQAGQERAIGQRNAQEERRRQRLAQSRLQAGAAASGAGASDPDILGLDVGIEEEGRFRSNLAMFNAEERAKSLETGASVARFEGEQAREAGRVRRTAGQIDAFSTLLGGFANTGLRARFS